MSAKNKTCKHEFMLDTVDLKIRHPAFLVSKPDLFSEPLHIKTARDIPKNYPMNKVFRKYTQNTPTSDKKAGVSNISLTVYRRFDNGELIYDLHIRCSLPKLLFGENLHEIRQGHLPRVTERLHSRLLSMGIIAEEKTLREAIITKVDFCANIVLPFPLTVREVLEELYKADMGERMQVNMREYVDESKMREYREHGESLHFHTTTRQFVFYDKLSDIEKDRGSSIDKNKTPQERSMSALLSSQSQILRFEARFNDTRAVRRTLVPLLPDLGDKPITLETIFNNELCRKALLRAWDEIVSRPGNQLAFKMEIAPEDALNHFITREVGNKSNVHALNRILVSFGLQQLIHRTGPKKARKKLQKVLSTKTVGTRLDTKIRDAALSLKDLPPSQTIRLISEALEAFQPFKTIKTNVV